MNKEEKEERREKFKLLRESSGLSQGQYAMLAGMTDRRFVSRIETGKQGRSPSIQQLRACEIVAFCHTKGQLDELRKHLGIK